MKLVALKSALSSKVADSKIFVIDTLALDEIKTKKVVDLLGNVGATKALIVTNELNENVYKSARNIEGVKASYVGELNVYELLKYDSLVISQDAVKKLEEVYAI